jgi:ligand-binding sensor domain-containing protein/signal transduction histidine kinase
MRLSSLPSKTVCFIQSVLALASFVGIVGAQRLPVRIYTPLEGLPGIAVHRIVHDSKGFLWFCTNEGISRFDGFDFVNYGTPDGLPEPNTNDLLETADGVYWVGTDGGLCRFLNAGKNQSAKSESAFEVFLPPGGEAAVKVNVLVEDRSRRAIWVGTEAGLYRLNCLKPERGSGDADCRFQQIPLLPIHPESTKATAIKAILCSPDGTIWVGSRSGLFLLKSEHRECYSTANGLPDDFILALTNDSQGAVWVGTGGGLCRLRRSPSPGANIVEELYRTERGLPSDLIKALLPVSEGAMWVGTHSGLAQLMPPSHSVRAYASKQGLSHSDINSLAQDDNGNIWVGTDGGGAIRIAKNAFITYGMQDGLGSSYVIGLLEDRTGRLCAVTKAPGCLYVNGFDGSRFQAVALPVSNVHYGSGWLGWYQVLAQSRDGEWWAASEKGLLRFSPVDLTQLPRTTLLHRYGVQDGLGGNHVFQVFEDSKGRLWISTRDPAGNALSMWDPASASFRVFSQNDGLPSLRDQWANGFFEDRFGQVWIGLEGIGVLRYKHDRFEEFSVRDGVPHGGIRRFHQDAQGRLWLGSGSGGLGRVDNPEAERPTFMKYDRSSGLSASEVQAITEDHFGRIYVGSGHGVDRLDPDSGRVRQYTSADGLASGEVQTALRDRTGALWFGTVQGVSRFIPMPKVQHSAPRVRLTALYVGGKPYSLPPCGSVDLTLGDLPPNHNHIQIDFAGLSFASGELLRYEYQLLGARRPVSVTSTRRSVTYAELPPGEYRFSVRAIDADGGESQIPATLQFQILAPIWMRGWFLALSSAAAAMFAFVAYHHRKRQSLAIDRLRTRLASDLHDEIGSGLSQIAILAEMARRHLNVNRPDAAVTLERVAEISRELVNAMSDLLWAMNARTDRLGDLTHRMQKFASDLFSFGDVEFEFCATGLVDDKRISFDIRRNIYLIFRESLRNVVRHSGCTRAAVHLYCQHRLFTMFVFDNGIGFDPSCQGIGQGISSMHERAREIGGKIKWNSQGGTSVTLLVPLDK